jgi:PqqD family protein of HPr-rel-A system
MQPAEPLRLHRAFAPALVCREWDGESVVYNHSTGNTHLLDEFSAMVLRQLIDARGPLAATDLSASLAGDATAEERDRCDAAVAAVLREFDRLGLVSTDAP